MTPHYDIQTLHAAYRANVFTWRQIQEAQDAHYQPCASCGNGLGKFRTLDDRDLCEACYLPIARAELRGGR